MTLRMEQSVSQDGGYILVSARLVRTIRELSSCGCSDPIFNRSHRLRLLLLLTIIIPLSHKSFTHEVFVERVLKDLSRQDTLTYADDGQRKGLD